MAEDHEGKPLRWDDSRMALSYANVCNITTSPEEVVLAFGTVVRDGSQDPAIAVSARVILNPVVARHMMRMLLAVLRDYEATYGELRSPGA